MKCPCVRRPDDHLTVFAVARDAGMRLDVALVHHRRRELALDDDVGLGEALLDVAALQLHAHRDVGRRRRCAGRRLALGDEVVVQDRRVGGERLVEGHHRLEHVV